jgi:Tol biopolymer transport system component
VSRTVLLSVSVVLALLAACIVALVMASTKPAEAAFPGRNGDIVFARRDPHTNLPQVYRMRPDGTGAKKLSDAPGERSWMPTFSADGTKIAFAHLGPECDDGCDWGWHDVWLMDANGSNERDLIDERTPYDDFEPAWYPSGRKIAFSSDRHDPGDDYDIYTLTLNAAGNVTTWPPTRLTFSCDREFADQPAVSPDGQRLAFSGRRDTTCTPEACQNQDAEIYVMDANAPEGDANVPRQLTDNATYRDSYPDFSPDGSKIVYTSFRNGNEDIFVMNADGTGKKNLTRNSAWDTDPAFSPDGRSIVFASNRDGDQEIWRMRASGSNPTKLTNNNVGDQQPDWQPRP